MSRLLWIMLGLAIGIYPQTVLCPFDLTNYIWWPMISSINSHLIDLGVNPVWQLVVR